MPEESRVTIEQYLLEASQTEPHAVVTKTDKYGHPVEVRAGCVLVTPDRMQEALELIKQLRSADGLNRTQLKDVLDDYFAPRVSAEVEKLKKERAAFAQKAIDAKAEALDAIGHYNELNTQISSLKNEIVGLCKSEAEAMCMLGEERRAHNEALAKEYDRATKAEEQARKLGAKADENYVRSKASEVAADHLQSALNTMRTRAEAAEEDLSTARNKIKALKQEIHAWREDAHKDRQAKLVKEYEEELVRARNRIKDLETAISAAAYTEDLPAPTQDPGASLIRVLRERVSQLEAEVTNLLSYKQWTATQPCANPLGILSDGLGNKDRRNCGLCTPCRARKDNS